MQTGVFNNSKRLKGQAMSPQQMRFIQPKLEINTPGDKYEQEADAMADRVIRMADNGAASSSVSSLIGPSVQRKCAECEEEEEKKPLMRKAENGGYGMQAPSSLVSSLNSTKGGGSPLPPGTRNFMESAFSADFSRVRVHTGGEASEMSSGINAKAFTHGSDIYFKGGEFSPGGTEGTRLLAHELTHVVQQKNRKGIQRDAISADLKLPCKWGDYFFEEQKITGIRILIGMAEDQRKSLPPIKNIAARINADNAIITDEKFKVKTCIISPNTTRFALFNGEPVLVIDPDAADIGSISHEMGHAVFHFLSHTTGNKINKQLNQEDFVANLTDIFLQLKQIVLNKGKDNEITANLIVDPSEWNPGAKPEHPTDVDEFFASAKEAFQINRKALMETFEKYGKQDKTVAALGKKLISLMSFLFEKGKLGKSQTLSSTSDAIKDQLGGLGEPSKLEETLSIHVLTDKLLDPEKRKDCK